MSQRAISTYWLRLGVFLEVFRRIQLANNGIHSGRVESNLNIAARRPSSPVTVQSYRSQFVVTGNFKTHFLEGGNGDPLILVHGAAPGANAEYSWKSVFPSLAGRFRTYAIDLLGFGRSEKPKIDYTYQRLVEQISEFVEALSLKNVRIAGNSVGAYVATHFALDHPEKVKKLVAIASTVLADSLGIQYTPSNALNVLDEYDGTALAMRRILDRLVYNKDLVTEEGVQGRNAIANSPGAIEALHSLRYFMRKFREDELFRQNFDIRNRLPNLRLPLLLIWGENDEFASIDIGYKVKAVLPNAEFAVIRAAGHQCMIDQPLAVSKAMLDFLAK